MINSTLNFDDFKGKSKEEFNSNKEIYFQLLFHEKDWDRLINIFKNDEDTTFLGSVLKMHDLTDNMFETMSEEQIIELLDYCKDQFRYKFLKLIRNQCDTNTKLSSIVEKIVNDSLHHLWVVQNFDILFVSLPSESIKTALSAIIPYSELNENNMKNNFAIFLLSKNSKYHFSKIPKNSTLSSFGTISLNFSHVNGNTKVRRIEFWRSVFSVLKEIFAFIQTLDPESPLISLFLTNFAPYLSCPENIRWVKNDELLLMVKQIIESFNVAKVFPNTIHKITSNNFNFLNRYGLNYDLYVKNHTISKKFIIDNFFIPTCIDEIENKQKHQNNIKVMARYVFRNYNDAFFAMRTDYIKDPASPLGKIWKSIIDRAATVAAEDFIEQSIPGILIDVVSFLSLNYSNSSIPLCTYDQALNIIETVIKELFNSKEKISSTNAKKYSELCVRLILILCEQNSSGSVYDTITELYDHTQPNVFYTLIDPETRDKLILESIRHPKQPGKFASWITERPTYVLVRMITMLSSISKVALLLPESRRNTLDKYGFQQSKITIPRTHSQGRGKPTIETDNISLLEAFIQRTKFWLSKDSNIIIENLRTYSHFANKALFEAFKNNTDIELCKNALGINRRLILFSCANLGQNLMKDQFNIAIQHLINPIYMQLGVIVYKNVNEFLDILFNLSNNIPIVTKGNQFPRINLACNLIHTHSLHTPLADQIAAEFLSKILNSIYDEFPSAVSTLNWNQIDISLNQLIDYNYIRDFVQKRTNDLSSKLLPDVSRIFGNDNKQYIDKTFTMLPPNPEIYEKLYMCFERDGYEHLENNGIAIINGYKFILEKINTYDTNNFKLSTTKLMIFIQSFMRSAFNDTLHSPIDILDLNSIDWRLIPNTDSVRNIYQRIMLPLRYSIGMIDCLQNIVNEKCPFYSFIKDKEETFNLFKTVHEFEFEDTKNASKIKEKLIWSGEDFTFTIYDQEYPLKFLDAKIHIREFYETLNNKLLGSYRDAFNITKSCKSSQNNYLLFKNIEFPKWVTPLSQENLSQEIQKLKKNRKLQKSIFGTDGYANAMLASICNSLINLKSNKQEIIKIAQKMKEDFRSIIVLLDYISEKNVILENTDLLSAIANEIIGDLVGMRKHTRSFFLKPNEISSTSGYLLALQSLERVGTCLQNSKSNIDTSFLTNLEDFSKLSEKTLIEGLGSTANNLGPFMESLLRSVNFGDSENSLQWIKNNHSPIFKMFHSPLLNVSQCIIQNFIESNKYNLKPILTGLCSAVVNGRYNILDNHINQITMCSLDTNIVGFPAPEYSFNYLLELAKTNSNVDVLRSILATCVEYILRQRVVLNPAQIDSAQIDHEEAIMNIMKISHAKLPDELTPFIFLMLSFETTLNAMRRSPALAEFANPKLFPIRFTHHVNEAQLILPKDGNFRNIYEKFVSEFVFSGLVSKKPHITELTINVLGSLKLGKTLPNKIAAFVSKGLDEFEPADYNKAFIDFAIQFVTKHEHQQFSDTIDKFYNVFQKLKQYSATVCLAKAKNMLLPPEDRSGTDDTTKLNEIYRNINSVFAQEVNDQLHKEISQEIRENLVSLSNISLKSLQKLKENLPLIVLNGCTQLINTLSLYSDENFKLTVSSEDKADSLSYFLRLLVSSGQPIEKLGIYTVSSLWEKLQGNMSLRHIRELAEWPQSFDHIRIINLISRKVIEKFPRDLSDEETNSLISKLGIFFGNENNVQPTCPMEPRIRLAGGALSARDAEASLYACGDNMSSHYARQFRSKFGSGFAFDHVQQADEEFAPPPPPMAAPMAAMAASIGAMGGSMAAPMAARTICSCEGTLGMQYAPTSPSYTMHKKKFEVQASNVSGDEGVVSGDEGVVSDDEGVVFYNECCVSGDEGLDLDGGVFNDIVEDDESISNDEEDESGNEELKDDEGDVFDFFL